MGARPVVKKKKPMVTLILKDHDFNTEPLGFVEPQPNGALRIRLNEKNAMTREQFFDTFGNIGAKVIQSVIGRDKQERIMEAEILSFGVSNTFAVKATR